MHAPANTMASTSAVTPRAHVRSLRAQRHPNADLAAALQHGVVEYAIEAHVGEQKRDGRKKQRKHRQQALTNGLRANQFRLFPNIADTELGSRARYFLTQDGCHCERVGARGAHHKSRFTYRLQYAFGVH
jgi:hypothetical protein